MTTTRRFPPGLYGVTPDWDDWGRLEDAVRQAVAGGMSALQWRHKTCPPAHKRDLAERLQVLCRELAVPLIINDDWQLAGAIGADGVHLGRDDASPAQVRQALGERVIIGASCYGDTARAHQMLTMDVHYIAFGAMFRSGTKPQAPPAPHRVLTEARALTEKTTPRVAVVAIGGITPDNAAGLVRAGADSVAVVGGLFLQANIEQAARRFSDAFKPLNQAGSMKQERT